jgi:hypothetical protein
MKRRLSSLVCLLGLLLTGLVFATLSRHQDQGPAYSLAQIQAHLARQPGRWLGRTVRVRGMVEISGCVGWEAGRVESCRDRSAYLLGRDGASLLPVAGWEPDPLLAALRRLPLAGGLVPAPQAARWGALATYRVRLLDAAPGTLGEG